MMRIVHKLARAVLAMLAVLGLAACEGNGTGSSELLGTWEAQLGTGSKRAEYRLEITPTHYTWTELFYAPDGRPGDGLKNREVRSGKWEIRGGLFAMHVSGLGIWSHPEGEWIVDYVPSWDETSHVTRLEGDRMTIEHRPPPQQSFLRPTLEFRRVR